MTDKHIEEVNWASRQRQRQGQPLMSDVQINVLIRLYNAKLDDAPFQPIEGINRRTLRKLQLEDLIFGSKGIDGERFKITGRGERVMKAYLRPVKFSDGLCPRCRTRPKRVSQDGKRQPYCHECERRIDKRQRELRIDGRYTVRPGRVCSTCREKPLHKFPSGVHSTYCTECLRRHKHDEKVRRRAKALDRIRRGEFIKCQKAECTNPVMVTRNTVYEVCREHWQAYINAYNDRRRPESQAARARRYGKRVQS